MPLTAGPTTLFIEDFGPQVPAAVAFTFGWFNVSGCIGGCLRGNVHADQDGTLLVEFANTCVGPPDADFTVAQCVTLTDFQYPFLISILQPFVRISFTNGGVASTFCRANAHVVP